MSSTLVVKLFAATRRTKLVEMRENVLVLYVEVSLWMSTSRVMTLGFRMPVLLILASRSFNDLGVVSMASIAVVGSSASRARVTAPDRS